MRLSIRPLKNFANINNFDYVSEWNIRQDEPNTLYFQLVDLDQAGLRYLPTDVSYGVTVTFPASNSANVLTKTAVQAHTLDRSIWSVALSNTENPGSGNVQFSLTEAGVIRRFSAMQVLVVEKLNAGGC